MTQTSIFYFLSLFSTKMFDYLRYCTLKSLVLNNISLYYFVVASTKTTVHRIN